MTNWSQPIFHTPEIECLILGLIFSLLSVQIKVDIHDFISGYDRVRGNRGQSALRKGWRTVTQFERDYKFFAGTAFLFSIVPVLIEPKRFYSVGIAIFLFYLGYRFGVSRKNRFIRDVALSIIAGPCLAFWIVPKLESMLFGLSWGMLVFFALQLEHFHFYFAQSQIGETNLLTYGNFDQAPNVLWSVWALCLLVYSFVRALTSHIAWWGGSVLILIVLSFMWRGTLFKLKSPAGSEIDKVVMAGNQLFFTFVALWVAELLFQVIVAPLVLTWFS
jgi:hypothetical protein